MALLIAFVDGGFAADVGPREVVSPANVPIAISLTRTVEANGTWAGGAVQAAGVGSPREEAVPPNRASRPRKSIVVGPGAVMARGALFLYQRGAATTKGQQCPMLPSCSEYARLAVLEHGVLRGVLMAADRLHRCGHDIDHYEIASDALGKARLLDEP